MNIAYKEMTFDFLKSGLTPCYTLADSVIKLFRVGSNNYPEKTFVLLADTIAQNSKISFDEDIIFEFSKNNGYVIMQYFRHTANHNGLTSGKYIVENYDEFSSFNEEQAEIFISAITSDDRDYYKFKVALGKLIIKIVCEHFVNFKKHNEINELSYAY